RSRRSRGGTARRWTGDSGRSRHRRRARPQACRSAARSHRTTGFHRTESSTTPPTRCTGTPCRRSRAAARTLCVCPRNIRPVDVPLRAAPDAPGLRRAHQGELAARRRRATECQRALIRLRSASAPRPANRSSSSRSASRQTSFASRHAILGASVWPARHFRPTKSVWYAVRKRLVRSHGVLYIDAMTTEPTVLYKALVARDARFDGTFFVGVTSTGIYCRPVCPAKTPKIKNCRFFSSPQQAEQARFRPCLRCRPELAPGNAPIDDAQRIAHLIVQRLEDDTFGDDTSLETIAARFKLSSRQIRRIIQSELGVPPIQLILTRRLLLAKQLLTETRLAV